MIIIHTTSKTQEVTIDTIKMQKINYSAIEVVQDADTVVFNERTPMAVKWFFNPSIGFNAIHAEANQTYNSFRDRLKPKFQIVVGRWFTHLFGLRLQFAVGNVDAYYLAGAIWHKKLNDFDYPDIILKDIYEKDGLAYYNRKFTYIDAGFAMTTDMLQWFNDKPERRLSLQVFLGPGIAYSFKSQEFDANASFALKAGMQVDVRIAENFKLSAELHGNILNEGFDGVYGGSDDGYRTVEGLAGASVGLSYCIMNKMKDSYDRINAVLYENIYITPADEIIEVIEPSKEIISTFTVRFLIDKYTIEANQEDNIHYVAKYLKKNKNAKVRLLGLADKETATPEYNQRLSEKRVASVKNYLIDECNIEEERIISEAMGDKFRAYEEDFRWNRVVIIEIVD